MLPQHGEDMRVLFINRSTANFYYTESVVDALLKHGHEVSVLFEKTREHWIKGEYLRSVEEFKKKYPDFTFGISFPRSDAWRRLVMPARVLLNYRRFLFAKNQSDYFKDRNIKYLPKAVKFILGFPGADFIIKSGFCRKALEKIEDFAGVDQKIFEQVKAYSPDVVLITLGGMRYGAMDTDYLKAAKACGKKTAVMALSWDSVSNKAFMHIKPDILLLWNDVHKEQAKAHHGVLEEKIKIVGAPVFDGWFQDNTNDTNFRTNAANREEFCRKLGFDSKNPILLYLGSPSTITADESRLVKEIRVALNNGKDERLKDAQIIFRPHPAHYKAYESLDIRGVTVSPKGGEMADTKNARGDFFNAMHHASAVLAVNTSGMIDAVIADKPVIVLMRGEYAQTQEQAEHFKAMMLEESFYITKTDTELLGVLKNILDGADDKKTARANFVRRFIRPRGIGLSAGECVREELEKVVQSKK